MLPHGFLSIGLFISLADSPEGKFNRNATGETLVDFHLSEGRFSRFRFFERSDDTPDPFSDGFSSAHHITKWVDRRSALFLVAQSSCFSSSVHACWITEDHNFLI